MTKVLVDFTGTRLRSDTITEEDAFGRDVSVQKSSVQETAVQKNSVQETSARDTVARELPDTKNRRITTREKRLTKEELLELSKKFKQEKKSK